MKFTVLQWNTWYKENPDNIISVLQSVDADIICLQELTQHQKEHNYIDVPKYLAHKTNSFLHFQVAQEWPSAKGIETIGNAILSRHELINKSYEYVQKPEKETTNDYSKEGRVVVFTTVDLGQIQIEVATTHLSYVHRFDETKQKLAEEDKLMELVLQKKENFILTGDFNVTEKSALIQKLTTQFKHTGPNFRQKTWTTKPFSYQGFEANKLNWRLDYVFCTNNLTVNSAKIIQTEFSDHLPILVEFEL